jgi:hypothetical protein
MDQSYSEKIEPLKKAKLALKMKSLIKVNLKKLPFLLFISCFFSMNRFWILNVKKEIQILF